MLKIAAPGLSNVHGQIADPLEIGVDLDGRHDDAEIRRHRLMQREQLEAAIIDFDMKVVDRLVARGDRVESVRVPVHETVHRFPHPFLGEAAHRQQSRREGVEFFLKMPLHAFHQPHLPVT